MRFKILDILPHRPNPRTGRQVPGDAAEVETASLRLRTIPTSEREEEVSVA